MMPELGAEIWFEILSQLPRAVLLELALVNRTFARQRREGLFRRFDFYPYAKGSDKSLLLPEAQDVDKALRRLDFWTSAAIAPNVRRCDVSPWYQGQYGQKFSASPEPYALLSAFFSHIGHFQTLVHLTFDRIQLSSSHLTILCELPTLRALGLDRCEVSAPASSSETIHRQTLGVQRFTFADHPDRKDALQPRLPLLDHSSIHTLSLNCDLLGLSKHLPIFTAVKVATLRMEVVNAASVKETIRLLAHFPEIVELEIVDGQSYGWGKTTSRVTSVPALDPAAAAVKNLTVPCQLLPAFLHGQAAPALTDLTIEWCTPNQFISALKKSTSGSSPRICSLAIQINDVVKAVGDAEDEDNLKLRGTVTAPKLRTILTSFPTLTQLVLEICCCIEPACDTNDIPMRLFSKLHSITTFPRTLITLLIGWNFSFDDPGDLEATSKRPTTRTNLPLRALFLGWCELVHDCAMSRRRDVCVSLASHS
ncbi:hypothetical protein C8F01DRAFT_1360539 [Mycena amicta]|nr:hypothetical protein C8F01DRAFT_1360539 [Mycena amicta]